MGVLLWEAVAEPCERFSACHCSAILELDGGDLLVGYYAGSGEARPDTVYVLTRKPGSAQAFDPLRIVAETPGKPEGNGILISGPAGHRP